MALTPAVVFILVHFIFFYRAQIKMRGLCCLTTELSDAGGPARSDCQLMWPARVRSSDFVSRCGYYVHALGLAKENA